MVKDEWRSLEDRTLGVLDTRAVNQPFVGQGVRDALRNAYRRADDDMPADFDSLLQRLN